MVSIKGLSKAAVLAALYNHSHAQGLGVLQFDPAEMTESEAADILRNRGERLYFNYLKGRVIKVSLASDTEFDESLYDRDNGYGAAQRAVDSITQNSETKHKPEWGIYPKDYTPLLYWGARAIITDGFVDLLWDRQSFQKADSVTDDEKDEFMAWLGNQAIPYFNQKVKAHDTTHIEFHSRDDRFHCIAEDRNSGGYLYIGAYWR